MLLMPMFWLKRWEQLGKMFYTKIFEWKVTVIWCEFTLWPKERAIRPYFVGKKKETLQSSECTCMNSHLLEQRRKMWNMIDLSSYTHNLNRVWKGGSYRWWTCTQTTLRLPESSMHSHRQKWSRRCWTQCSKNIHRRTASLLTKRLMSFPLPVLPWMTC